MTRDLDMHAASPDELVAAHRNVFDIWSRGRSLDEHVRYRLNSPTHRRAQWFVGCLDGRVVTSLAAHPVRFHVGGEDLRGIAIGSVYTLAEVRGRGYAAALIAWVERRTRNEGAALSVLYSDVNPAYYARQGYTLCPAWQGWRDVRESLPGPVTQGLEPFSVNDRLADVKRLYASYHGAAPLSIARDDAYWAMMLEKYASDQFYALAGPGKAWVGYALLGSRANGCHLIDYALADQTDETAERLYAALLAAAAARGESRAGGWMPDSPAARKFFALEPRRDEITMIKPLAWGGTLSAEMIAGTSRFCELDHV
jgi:predicted N-acetyltransferase YhbS